MYKVNNKEFDYNSRVNQAIKERFVDRNIITNMSEYVNFIFECEFVEGIEPLFRYEDIENLYINDEEESQEIMQWWEVDSYFCKQLVERGESVILDMNLWGRATVGQAITDDWIITKICYDMGILEGQENSWEKFRGI